MNDRPARCILTELPLSDDPVHIRSLFLRGLEEMQEGVELVALIGATHGHAPNVLGACEDQIKKALYRLSSKISRTEWEAIKERTPPYWALSFWIAARISSLGQPDLSPRRLSS